MQGWEAECWGVLGLSLLENKKVGRIHQMSISYFSIDMKFISKVLGELFTGIFIISRCPSSFFDFSKFQGFEVSDLQISNIPKCQHSTSWVRRHSNNFRFPDYQIWNQHLRICFHISGVCCRMSVISKRSTCTNWIKNLEDPKPSQKYCNKHGHLH